jgi:hypothetical protein
MHAYLEKFTNDFFHQISLKFDEFFIKFHEKIAWKFSSTEVVHHNFSCFAPWGQAWLRIHLIFMKKRSNRLKKGQFGRFFMNFSSI